MILNYLKKIKLNYIFKYCARFWQVITPRRLKMCEVRTSANSSNPKCTWFGSNRSRTPEVCEIELFGTETFK